MMEDPEEEARPRGSLEFVNTSILNIVVPMASDLDIGHAIHGSIECLDEGKDSLLVAIPQRTALFFGEYPSRTEFLYLTH